MISPEVRTRIRTLYFGEQWTVRAIARELGIGYSVVFHMLGTESALEPVLSPPAPEPRVVSELGHRPCEGEPR